MDVEADPEQGRHCLGEERCLRGGHTSLKESSGPLFPVEKVQGNMI